MVFLQIMVLQHQELITLLEMEDTNKVVYGDLYEEDGNAVKENRDDVFKHMENDEIKKREGNKVHCKCNKNESEFRSR